MRYSLDSYTSTTHSSSEMSNNDQHQSNRAPKRKSTSDIEPNRSIEKMKENFLFVSYDNDDYESADEDLTIVSDDTDEGESLTNHILEDNDDEDTQSSNKIDEEETFLRRCGALNIRDAQPCKRLIHSICPWHGRRYEDEPIYGEIVKTHDVKEKKKESLIFKPRPTEKTKSTRKHKSDVDKNFEKNEKHGRSSPSEQMKADKELAFTFSTRRSTRDIPRLPFKYLLE